MGRKDDLPPPLAIHSHYSLLKSTLKPSDIVEQLKIRENSAAALTDISSLAGSVQFIKELKAAKIKPIIGLELDIVDDSFIKDKNNTITRPFTILARNFDGWKQLIRLHNLSHSSESYYYKPRIDILKIANIATTTNDLLAYSGRPGSDLANSIFTDLTYNQVDENWEIKITAICRQYQEYFKDRFYLEICIDQKREYTKIIAECLRKVGQKLNIPRVFVNPIHFSKQLVNDCHLLLAIGAKKPLQQAAKFLQSDLTSREIFRSSNFEFSSPSVLEASDDELDSIKNIVDQCEIYDIISKPKLPIFECPSGTNEVSYLRELCRKGYKEKLLGKIDKNKTQNYVDRINYELFVVEKAGISAYFLIVQDYINAAKKRGELVGPGRGSSAGCLISYLTNITEIDPLEYNLMFERFYNDGRNSPGNIQYPDIDSDFMKSRRQDTIDYIRNKYGHDKVSHICTFGRLQGRAALKEVLRMTTNLSFDEINKITKPIPDESKIAEDLQEMREEDEEASIIRWSIENKKELQEYCRENDDGSLTGDLANQFAQAIRIEGIKKSQGQHASGIIISTDVLGNNCPMVHSAGGELIAGMDFKDLEAMGYIKCDILGLTMLDKIYGIKEMTTKVKE